MCRSVVCAARWWITLTNELISALLLQIWSVADGYRPVQINTLLAAISAVARTVYVLFRCCDNEDIKIDWECLLR
jgi:hypothetical protein